MIKLSREAQVFIILFSLTIYVFISEGDRKERRKHKEMIQEGQLGCEGGVRRGESGKGLPWGQGKE